MQFSTSFMLAALVASTTALELQSTALTLDPAVPSTPTATAPTAVDCSDPVSTTRADTNLLSLGARAYEPQTVTIQLYGENDIARTTGGEAPTFRLEDRCATNVMDLRCADDGTSTVTGLPIEGLMTDNMDGTYSYTFTTPGGVNDSATVTASILVLTSGGLYAEFFDDREQTNPPLGTRTETPIQSYGTGPVGLSGAGDLVGASWSGKLCVPTTETYDYKLRSDDSFNFIAGGATISRDRWNGGTFNFVSADYVENTLYDFDIDFAENFGVARVDISWSSPSTTIRTVPTEYFWSTQRIYGTNDIVIAPATSPADSTLESSPAGDSIDLQDKTKAMFTFQSRSSGGIAQSVQNDVYTVTLTCNDADACGTESYSTTAAHTTDGLYSAHLDPTVVGTYDVAVTMMNACTAANPWTTTTVSDSTTLTVVDNRSVPSTSTIETDPTTDSVQPDNKEIVRAGVPLEWTFQSRNAAGEVQPNGDDVWKVYLVCAAKYKTEDSCDQDAITIDAVHQGNGLYKAELAQLTKGQYSVLITMNSCFTEANPGVASLVNSSMLRVYSYQFWHEIHGHSPQNYNHQHQNENYNHAPQSPASNPWPQVPAASQAPASNPWPQVPAASQAPHPQRPASQPSSQPSRPSYQSQRPAREAYQPSQPTRAPRQAYQPSQPTRAPRQAYQPSRPQRQSYQSSRPQRQAYQPQRSSYPSSRSQYSGSPW